MTAWQDVWNALSSHIGFVEGPGNRNPWTEAMGFGDCAYCSAFASVCPHQQAGVQWPHYVQVPPTGEAYSPDWERFPSWAYDHASRGQPVDLAPGDIVTYDWTGNGTADHTETVVQVYADGSFDTIGANTGSPEGVHYPIRRDRRYLVGRFRPSAAGVWAGGAAPGPAPAPAPKPPVPSPEEDDMIRLFQHTGGVHDPANTGAWYIGVIGAWYNHIPSGGVLGVLQREHVEYNNVDGTPVIQSDVFDSMVDLGSLATK